MTDLTCAIVHWNVPELLADCLASLLPEVEALRRRGMSVDVTVVDNASRPEVRQRLQTLLEEERLRRETSDGVTVHWSEKNLGYPRACNLAYAASAAPLVLISNPDIVYFPGSLERMVDALEARPDAALAGPASWWDRKRTLMLNPGYPESHERIEGDARARREGTWLAHALDWQRRMAEIAFAPETREIDIISGASMLLRRGRIDAAGGLFDPALFLYYDDTDLCARLSREGMPALYVPGAEIVHLFNQSRRNDVADHMAASRRHFLSRHYGEEEADRLLALAAEAVPGENEFAEAWNGRDLGLLDAPPSFEWQAPAGGGRTLFALGLNPQVVPAAMALRERPEMRLTERFWRQLSPGPYWARATDRAARQVLAYWKFEVPAL
jgi:N-acetylglucosaminyl-diphospho-decaprenol L-rhamnosyltransferase